MLYQPTLPSFFFKYSLYICTVKGLVSLSHNLIGKMVVITTLYRVTLRVILGFCIINVVMFALTAFVFQLEANGAWVAVNFPKGNSSDYAADLLNYEKSKFLVGHLIKALVPYAIIIPLAVRADITSGIGKPYSPLSNTEHVIFYTFCCCTLFLSGCLYSYHLSSIILHAREFTKEIMDHHGFETPRYELIEYTLHRQYHHPNIITAVKGSFLLWGLGAAWIRGTKRWRRYHEYILQEWHI